MRSYLNVWLTRELLQTRRLRLVTHLKRTMANRLMLLHDKLILRRRVLVESVFDQLKHLMQIEHTRHRSPTNFAINLLAGLVAYCHQPNKPSIGPLSDSSLPGIPPPIFYEPIRISKRLMSRRP